MLFAVLSSAISISLFIYSMFLFHQKGPVPTTEYIFTKPEERKKIKTKAEYRFTEIIMLTLSIVFLLVAIGIVLSLEWIYGVVIVISIVLAAYALVHSIRETIKH